MFDRQCDRCFRALYRSETAALNPGMRLTNRLSPAASRRHLCSANTTTSQPQEGQAASAAACCCYALALEEERVGLWICCRIYPPDLHTMAGRRQARDVTCGHLFIFPALSACLPLLTPPHPLQHTLSHPVPHPPSFQTAGCPRQ